ncbi:flagellin [Porticoccaceae bacterium nBUS_09]
MTVINTNIAASITANAMKANQRVMENTMERLSTGMRINSASDDAAGLAIGSKMEAQIRGLGQSIRNSNDGISMIQTADGAANQIGDMLQRMRELAVQSQNSTNSSAELANLNKEFAALATEIDRVADDTTFNNINVLNGLGDKTFTVGADQADTVTVTFGDFNLAAGATSATAGKFDLNITQTQLRTLGETKTLSVADSDGNVVNITHSEMEAAQSTVNGSAVTDGFTSATLAGLVQAFTNELSAGAATNTAFQFDTTLNGSTGVTFTQKTATSGYNVVSVTSVTDSSSESAAISGVTVSNNATQYAAGTGVMGALLTDFKTAGQAQTTETISELDDAIAGVASARADFGAAINSLEYSIDSLQAGVQNTMSAKSAIMDADYAAETTELARTQIISQAATAMLSQANQAAQSVLALLK